MKDTPPEINAQLFAAMMKKTPAERLLMGFDMMATARRLAWASLEGDEEERREAFFQRFHNQSLPSHP